MCIGSHRNAKMDTILQIWIQMVLALEMVKDGRSFPPLPPSVTTIRYFPTGSGCALMVRNSERCFLILTIGILLSCKRGHCVAVEITAQSKQKIN